MLAYILAGVKTKVELAYFLNLICTGGFNDCQLNYYCRLGTAGVSYSVVVLLQQGTQDTVDMIICCCRV